MSALVAAPVLLPLLAAAAGFVAHRSPRLQRWIGLASSTGLAIVSVVLLAAVRERGLLVTAAGSWPAPHGVSFVADLFSATMVCATALLGLTVVVYAAAAVDRRRLAFGFQPLVQVLLAGACGALLTSDLFNLFVWFEVMLIASFVLMALGGTRAQLEGATKYVTLNLIASTFLLCGAGLVYGITGTLDFSELALRLADRGPEGPLTAAVLLVLAALGIKSAVFPVFFWLPASYHTPPAAVSALFAGLLTKVGVYALVRVVTLAFGGQSALTHDILLWVAGLTMVTGVLGAAAQTELRRILSFHIVSQIGYMLMGLGLSSVLALGGAIFFILHNIAAKSALFLAAGVVERQRGTGALARLGGLARARPLLAGLFLVPALSLAGLPPLSGFVGKLLLVRAGLEARAFGVTAAALVVSLLTLYSMMKIWLRAFWGTADDGDERAAPPRSAPPPRAMMASLFAIALATVLLGVLAEPVVRLSMDAAEQLLDAEAYAEAVRAAGLESAPRGEAAR
jgi:multicomponent Na+:H+ antiporter subunit D